MQVDRVNQARLKLVVLYVVGLCDTGSVKGRIGDVTKLADLLLLG